MADHLNTNGLVAGDIPAGRACPFRFGCPHRTARCPDKANLLAWPFSCASARACSMLENTPHETRGGRE